MLFQQEMQPIIMTMGKRIEIANQLLKLLYIQPIQTPQAVEKSLNISASTANSLLKEFEKCGILQEITGNKRGRMYAMTRYLNIF